MPKGPGPKADGSYSEEETTRRRDATIRAMIRMPPKNHEPRGGTRADPKGRSRKIKPPS
jgi:hypothetical protein